MRVRKCRQSAILFAVRYFWRVLTHCSRNCCKGHCFSSARSFHHSFIELVVLLHNVMISRGASGRRKWCKKLGFRPLNLLSYVSNNVQGRAQNLSLGKDRKAENHRRLANGTIHCAGSATYQISFWLPIPNPNPNPKP